MHTMKCFAGVLVAVAAASLSAADEAAPASVRHELTAGDISVAMSPFRDGLQISVGGVWVVRGCELVVTTPSWSPHYYHGPSQTAVVEAKVERSPGHQTITMKHVGTAGAFAGTETITLHPDRRVEQTLDGVFNGDADDCLIQWRIAAMNPALFIGMPFEATRADGQTTSGVIPVMAASAEQKDTTVAHGFAKLAVQSRIGTLTLETDSAPKLVLYDFRKDKYANPEEPLFWFGDLGTRFKKGEPIRYRIVYHLPRPADSAPPPKMAQAVATIAAREDAQRFPTTDPPTLIPAPKKVKFEDGHLDLTDFAIATREGVKPPDGQRAHASIFAELLAESIHTNYGNLIKPRQGRQEPNPWPFEILLGLTDPPLAREGYVLRLDGKCATVSASDEAGLRHAARTLFQLCEVTPDGRLLARAGTIRDWPSLGVRGVHLFTGGRGPDVHLKLIERVLGPLKMNHVVLQCDFLKWDSHPEIHHAELGMAKEEVRDLLDAARHQGIEVTPLVMSLGHMHWMFHNDENLDLAEDPEAKWSYCVTNPKSYDFIFSIYDEALQLFKPRWFHIGHDEFANRGRVPFRDSSKPFTVEQLFLKDMERMVAYFKERGVRIMMWGDMLLAPGEAPDACNADSREAAERRREAIPNDVIVADWHYVTTTPDKLGSSLKVFRDAGHETIAAGWNRPGNIVNFCRAAFEQGSLGYLQTTWAGYSLDAQSFARELPQYASYVLAAEAAWNAENPPKPDDYPSMSHFLDLMRMTPLAPDNRGGWTADLSRAYNAPLAFSDESLIWRGLSGDYDLSTAPAGDVRLKGVAFKLADAPADAEKPAAIALRSRLCPSPALPTEVEIELNAEAERVVVLHATNFECIREQRVGEYELVFENGQKRTYPVQYGRHVFAYNNPSATPEGPIVWAGQSRGGAPLFLRAMVLSRRGLVAKQGEPSKRIAKLIVRSADAPGSLIVLGVTGLAER